VLAAVVPAVALPAAGSLTTRSGAGQICQVRPPIRRVPVAGTGGCGSGTEAAFLGYGGCLSG
jgi:hypothetical protein